MKLDFVQTHANLTNKYEVYHNKKLVYSVNVPFRFIGQEAYVYEADKIKCILKFDRVEALKTTFSPTISRLPFQVLNIREELIGYISGHRTKFFGGYTVYDIILNRIRYEGYQVGMGKQGVYFPLYLNDNQIAQIHKPPVVIDNKDLYQITTKQADDLLPVCLFALYMDIAFFSDKRAVAVKSKQINYYYTLNKTLKSKYNPNFRED